MKSGKGLEVVTEDKILITDSCVLFDLIDLNLLQDFFKLDSTFYTTPQVIGEITDENQFTIVKQFIDINALVIDSTGAFGNIQKLYDNYPGLSYVDCSVLELTQRTRGILLSSDKNLRNITKNNNLDVRGVLWIIREMVNNALLSKERAVHKLRLYPSINARAPINEINKLIEDLNASL